MISSLFTVVVAALSVAAQTPDASSETSAAASGIELQQHSVIRPIEVRTRRLHMVRPDLIRFPIVYDTLC